MIAAGTEYFGWTDAERATPSGLARLFIERFPEIVEAGRGSDWTYAGWYIEMLGLTFPNRFHCAYSDWDDDPEDHLLTLWFREGEEVNRDGFARGQIIDMTSRFSDSLVS